MKKKGFTLIELLAVIIILSVIALISVPVILNVVNESKEKARIQSVTGYADAVKLSYTEEMMNNTGTSLKELADGKMQGEEVVCEYVKYDNKEYGAMLHTCNVSNEGNYCYINGKVYNNESEECKNVYSIIFNDNIPYNTPTIVEVNQTPSDTEYAQSKEIKIEYPSLKVVEEHYFIKTSKSIEINNVVSICGTQDTPSDCTSSNVTSIEANTWYEVSGEVTLTTTSNISIEAIIGNNNEYGSKAAHSVSKMDTTGPSVNITSVATTSSKAVVYESCEDLESGISKVEYSVNGGEYQSSNVFENLSSENKYKFKVRCTNGSGMIVESEETEEISLSEITAPTISQISQIPENSTYAQQRVIRITYTSENVESPKHYYSLDGYTWEEVTGTTKDVTFTSNGYLYAKTVDGGGNVATSATFTVTNIDTSEPSVSITSVGVKTDRATVTANCSDIESNITKYEFSSDNGTTWTSNGTTNSYTFIELEQDKEYTFAIRCTNGSGLTETASESKSTLSITNPSVAYENTPETATNGYLTSQTIKVTYNNSNIENPEYFVKTTRTGVSSLEVTESCGTGTIPGDCTTISSTINLSANTWYKVSGDVDITYSDYSESEGTLYVLTHDGKNYSGSVTATISKITKEVTYIVNHYQMNTDMTNYTLYETETLTGIANYTVTPSVKEYEGFTSPSTQTVTILADGSTVVEYRYTRKQVVVTFYRNTSTSDTTTSSQTFTYGVSGQAFSDKGWTKEGYTLGGWSSANRGSKEYPALSGVIDSWKNTNSPQINLYAVWYKNPTIAQISQIPENSTYASSRVMQVTYDGTNIANPTYYFRADASTSATVASGVVTGICGNGENPGTCSSSTATVLSSGYWYQTSSTTPNITFTSNGTLYAATYDGISVHAVYATNSYIVNNIDESKPSTSITSVSAMTDRATVTASCEDLESSITKYEFSNDGSNWTSTGTINNYTFTNLEQSKEYVFRVRCTNGSGLTNTATYTESTETIVNPTIVQISQTPSSGTYAQSRVLRITFNGTNVEKPKYYYSLNGTTWTQVSTTTYDVTFTSNGYLYAKTVDEKGNTASSATYTVTNIDTQVPTIIVYGPTNEMTSDPKFTTGLNGVKAYNNTGNTNLTLTRQSMTTNFGTSYALNITTTGTVSPGLGGFIQYSIPQDFNEVYIHRFIAKVPVGYTVNPARNWADAGGSVYWITSNTGTGQWEEYAYVVKIGSTLLEGKTSVKNSTFGYVYLKGDTTPVTWYVSYSNMSKVNTNGKGATYWFQVSDNTGLSSYQITSGTTEPTSWTTLTNDYISHTPTTSGTYTLWLKDVAGNITSKTYTITVDDGTPTAPTITGGSTSWSSTAKTISVSTASTAPSGIAYYQYYISTSSTSQTGGSWTNLASGTTSASISTNGTRYIYFRAVSNSGKVSAASSPQTTMVDTTAPTVSVSVSGTTATFTLKDNLGVVGYGVNQSTSTQPTYTPITQSTSTSGTYTATSAGDYVVWVKDVSGRTAYATFTIDESAFSYAATNSSYAATATETWYCSQPKYTCSDGTTGHGTSPNCTVVSWDYNSCAKWEVSGTSYSCPNGGTLSGTTCVLYTCPNGGTLNSTTKICEK